jgi:hypothetical protein
MIPSLSFAFSFWSYIEWSNRILISQLTEAYKPEAESLCSAIVTTLGTAADYRLKHPGMALIPDYLCLPLTPDSQKII